MQCSFFFVKLTKQAPPSALCSQGVPFGMEILAKRCGHRKRCRNISALVVPGDDRVERHNIQGLGVLHGVVILRILAAGGDLRFMYEYQHSACAAWHILGPVLVCSVIVRCNFEGKRLQVLSRTYIACM